MFSLRGREKWGVFNALLLVLFTSGFLGLAQAGKLNPFDDDDDTPSLGPSQAPVPVPGPAPALAPAPVPDPGITGCSPPGGNGVMYSCPADDRKTYTTS